MFKNLFVISSTLLLGITSTNAAMLPQRSAKHDIDQLERRQTQQTIEEEKSREKQLYEMKQDAQPAQDSIGLPKKGHQFQIEKIVIMGDDEFDLSAQRQAIVDRYSHKQLGSSDILNLIRELTDFYISKGYSTTLVTIVPGNLKEGTLTLKVLWGKIAAFSSHGQQPTFRESSRLFSAMPFAKNKKLNMQDVDQGIDNLMRVSQGDKLVVVPAQEAGYSVIDLQGAAVTPFSGSIGTNNSGNEAEGWGQYFASLNVNNLAGLNDVFNIYYSFNDLKHNSDDQDSWSASYSLPLGYWTFDALYYHSGYSKEIGGYYGGYHSEGTSDRLSLKVSRLLFRDSVGKTSAYAKLETRESENLIEDEVIGVSSKRYTSLTGGVNRVGTLFGGWLYGDLSVTAGTPWFDSAWDNDPDLQGFDLNYVKYNGSVNWSKTLAEYGRIGANYVLNSGFQYTNGVLVSEANFSVGDEFTVRGYKDSFISANNAAYISNTFEFPISIYQFGLYQITPFIGYDLGVVDDNCHESNSLCHTEYMTGAAVGIKANGNHFSTSLTYSWPLAEPQSLEELGVSEPAIYYSVSLNF